MGLRFFADHCVARSVAERLTAAGHEVFRLRDHLPTDAADEDVIQCAQDLEAILISLNGDFADIVRYPPAQYRGIVALQVKNHPEVTAVIVGRLLEYLEVHREHEQFAGKLLLVEAHRIRIQS